MRYLQLDFIRGIAIVLMVVFHISFDLNNFNFINIDIYNGLFWKYFRLLILTLFILSVGISLELTNKNTIDLKKNLKRSILLLFFSTLISISSYFIFPNTWIYFGVLHFIAFGSILGLLFIKLKWLNLFIGSSVVIGSFFNFIDMHWLYNSLQELLYLPRKTEDLVSFTPWFGVLLIGIFIAKKELYLFTLRENKFTLFISYLGKHSLVIYLIHQPIFFGISLTMNYLLH